MVTKLLPVSDSLSTTKAGQSLSLIKSEEPTSSGTHYFDFKYEFENSWGMIRIWSNELVRFARLLERVLNSGFDEVDWNADGTFPLELDVSTSGGLGAYVYVKDGEASLVFRRLNASFRGKGGGTAFTKYLNWYRAGKWVAQVKIPVDESCRELLTALSEQLHAEISSLLCPIADQLALQFDSTQIEELVSLSERLTFSGKHHGENRTMNFDIGHPDFSAFQVACCPSPLLELILPTCAEATSQDSISKQIDFALDAEAIKRLLTWNVRYLEETLRAGFIAAPFSAKETGDTVVAFRDKTIFASDPLLMSLIPFEAKEAFEELEGDMKWVSVSQFKSPPFEHALTKGIASGPYGSGLGKVVYPKTKQKSKAIRKLAIPTMPLKRNRWRILQLMNLYSCQLANTSFSIKFGFEERLVLQTQRLALLINDVCRLFEDSIELVEDFVEDAKQVYLNTITDCAEPKMMSQPSELPKMPKESS